MYICVLFLIRYYIFTNIINNIWIPLSNYLYYIYNALASPRRSSNTSFKRKLCWQEQGADLSAYERPLCLGGPGDKRIRDFTPKLADQTTNGSRGNAGGCPNASGPSNPPKTGRPDAAANGNPGQGPKDSLTYFWKLLFFCSLSFSLFLSLSL